jgi:DNA-binding Xre family transcriptional regulator
MAVVWNLKKWLVIEHNIFRPSELQALLAERANTHLSLQAISTLINNPPQALRMNTMQALCNALNCKVSDFFDVTPDVEEGREGGRQVVGATTHLSGAKRKGRQDSKNVFPDPRRHSKNRENK